MRSFSVRLDEFFALKRRGNVSEDFDQGKRKLLIPLYQREYKWEDDKIEGLISDIYSRDKFLGIIILDEGVYHYEIVDGQQRITTCYLIMMALYNLSVGQPLEQNVVLTLMQCNNAFTLRNDSIGEYIANAGDRLDISISDEHDIYYQKETFLHAFSVVMHELEKYTYIQRREFFSKLKDCEFVVLINDTYSNTRPIEQIFLDINEKSQLLDVEDIFKGHCFENYDEASHQELKQQWAVLKKHGVDFTRFGYSGLSEYLYLFLLTKNGKSIPENLTINGRHCLSGKSMDETAELIGELNHYGRTIVGFSKNLSNDDYRFVDICNDSSAYARTNDHKMLKIMSKDIICYAKAQYQKLPFFEFIAKLALDNGLKESITHDQLKRIITNLYVYASLFITGRGKKSKGCIDWTFLSVLSQIPIQATSIVAAAKKLRSAKVNEYEQVPLFNPVNYGFVTSIIDHYVSLNNWLQNKHSQDADFTCEHLIIPDNRQKRISWCDQDSKTEIQLANLHWDKYKKLTINYLFLNRTLNESMEHDDVVTKVETIRSWYTGPGKTVPNHVRLMLDHIEGMGEYGALAALKGRPATVDEIRRVYNIFIDAFFGDDNQASLLSQITNAFKNAFRNDGITAIRSTEASVAAG